MSDTAQALIDMGLSLPDVGVFLGQQHEFVQTLARNHAKYQAARCMQSHENFEARHKEISRVLGLKATEICAESWPWQADDSLEDLASEMFVCWKQSPGHWSVCVSMPKYYGCDMARGRNGIWYACVIAGN